MKEYTINNETIKIEDLINIEKNVFFRKITPKFFSHDEDEYHIESKVELILHYLNESKEKIEKSISFYNEYMVEYIGQEVEVEVEEFIEVIKETPEFENAKNKLNQTLEILKNDFEIRNWYFNVLKWNGADF